MARKNQHKPLPPEDELHQWVSYYWHLGLSEADMAVHILDHFDQSKYGLSSKSVQRARQKIGLRNSRQRNSTFETIAPFVMEIRERFPTIGARQKAGGFKLASFGTSDYPMFGGQDRVIEICAKQTFYNKKKVMERGGKQVELTQNIPYDGPKQAQDIMMEVVCLVWALALFDLVYSFVDMELKKKGPAPFEIPRMRFVEGAFAIEKEGDKQVFLLEELIGKDSEGRFRKYLNNTSPVPLTFNNEDDIHRAQFLGFTQHVQYYKTKRLAFVSDLQGGNSLLTDPQIVTHSELGNIFAGGNLPQGHENFEKDHVCNKFCKFFDVPTDYEIWESRSSIARPQLAPGGQGI
jgi:hypothetical protein